MVAERAPASLRDRLRHAIGVQAAVIAATPAPVRVVPRELPPIEQILGGEWRETEHGRVFVRDVWYSLDHAHGSLPLGSALDAAPDGLTHLIGGIEAPHPSRLAFFDIETTGLAGGTGTYIVLAGLGTYEEAIPGEGLAFRIRQYFLAEIAGERAMLAMLAADIGRFEALVTYNGRAFDVPVVEARLTLSRLPSPCGPMAHFDLLHAVRRLYKHRMPGCRLAEAERRLLRIERHDDVPGSLIPQLYFDYVRAGRAAPLRGVFQHNAEDVLSLVGILASLADMLTRDDLDPDDAVAVARWRERVGDTSRALRLYESALPWLEGGPDWTWAAARLARLYKQEKRRDDAMPLWRTLSADGDVAASIELAMHFEHHSRDYAAASAVVDRLLTFAATREVEALAYRRTRIERKAASIRPNSDSTRTEASQ